MRTQKTFRRRNHTGSALLLTLMMTGIALAILASAMTWSANSTKLTHRSIQYSRAVVAAEAATEKVLTRISQDYLKGGEKLVADNLATYKGLAPNGTDSTFWSNWEFNNAEGVTGQTHVRGAAAGAYSLLNSEYSGLRGFITTYTVVAHARETALAKNVEAGVLQEVQLARIPIFQFAMYSAGDMEISCGQDFKITGQVHSNKKLYVEPDAILTFQSAVTAVTGIDFSRHPNDTRTAPKGSYVYEQPDLVDPSATAMTLPIGMTNTAEAVREIIHPPPSGGDTNAQLARMRLYNQADMILVVSNSGISATSGKFNNFATAIPAGELASFVTTTNQFKDDREGKFVKPVDINVGQLTTWSQTNTSLNAAMGSTNMSSIYVLDRRTLPGTNLSAVRVTNGRILPTAGLTVATARPLYVQGHFNQTNAANLGTNITVTTRPASLIADAVTILSENWTDTRSTNAVASRVAAHTTVNAALLTGVVETTRGQYSGGMENFPRFLETWGSANTFTYNGSMVKMFPSLYATNVWGKANVYAPPKRNWAFDLNFNDAKKLPPLTPSLVKVFRGQWATVPPNTTVAAAAY